MSSKIPYIINLSEKRKIRIINIVIEEREEKVLKFERITK